MNKPAAANSFRTGPDEQGMFGIFGGRFVAETLMPLILDLQAHWDEAKTDPAFKAELEDLNTHYTGRPSPLYFAERLTEHLGGAKIYFKRDELNHTGSHKINNCLGQILLARRMGKTRIIAETGAGQHGVASATVSARFGFPCVVYMGATDVRAAGAERVPHEAARRGSDAGHLRPRHAEGRDERGAARLGHQCRRHLLPDRHGGGSASLSGDGARLPVGDRQGDEGADDGRRRPPAGHAGRRRRRRLERDRPVPPVPRRQAACRSSASRPAARAWKARSIAPR